jgi:outer membrane protein assembly factor BamB
MPKGKAVVLKSLPTLWSYRVKSQAVGLHVDDREVWGGWENGMVVAVDHAGKTQRKWRLPSGVDALIADEDWRYAGCHDGNVYDLTGRTPRVAYEVGANARIHWIDVFRGNLCASDIKGACTVVDADQKLMWKAAPRGASAGWMVRADEDGVYVGNSKGVTKYTWAGKKKWATTTRDVGFGWQEDARVFAFVGFRHLKQSAVVAIDKESGKVRARGSCWSTKPHYRQHINAASCAAVGTDRIFGATAETLFCFDGKGSPLWEAPAACGTPCSMAVYGDRLYVATHDGHLAAIDISDKAIAAAKKKTGKQAKTKRVVLAKETARKVETVKAKGAKGIVVECFKDGSKVRIRVVSAGYNADWFCQFPRDIREVGARYVVDEVREATQGGFYRVLGNIRRLR